MEVTSGYEAGDSAAHERRQTKQRPMDMSRGRDLLGGIDEPLRARPEIDAGGSKRFPASPLSSSFVNSMLATHAASI